MSHAHSESKTAAQSDVCRPALCALGRAPHAHCACGLPMPVGAALCDLCRSEGHVPTAIRMSDHEIEWDGQRYPSRRQNHPTDVPAERYDELLRDILGPVRGRQAALAASEEAA